MARPGPIGNERCEITSGAHQPRLRSLAEQFRLPRPTDPLAPATLLVVPREVQEAFLEDFDRAHSASASSSHMSQKSSLRFINLRIANSDWGNRRFAADNPCFLPEGPLFAAIAPSLAEKTRRSSVMAPAPVCKLRGWTIVGTRGSRPLAGDRYCELGARWRRVGDPILPGMCRSWMRGTARG